LQMKRRFLGNFIKMVDWEDWTSLSRHCHRVSLGVTWRPACMRQSPTWITVKTLAVNKMALDMLKHTGVETESLLCYVLTYLLKRCVTGRYIWTSRPYWRLLPIREASVASLDLQSRYIERTFYLLFR
jgi:hypothetical protein